jgi:hypothetical protein
MLSIVRQRIVSKSSVVRLLSTKACRINFIKSSQCVQNMPIRSQSSLVTVLQNEIKLEGKDNASEDKEYQKIKKNILKAWKLNDELGLGIVTLTSQHKSETIKITFDCQVFPKIIVIINTYWF